MRNNNFDELVANPENINDDPLDIPFLNPATIAEWRPGPTDVPLVPALESFAKSPLDDYEILFAESFDLSVSDFLPSGLFNIESASMCRVGVGSGATTQPGGATHQRQTTPRTSRFNPQVYEEVVSRKYLELRSERLLSEQAKIDKKIADQLGVEQRKEARIANKLRLEEEKEARRVAKEEHCVAKELQAKTKRQEDSIKRAEKEENNIRRAIETAAAEKRKRLRKEEDAQHLAMLKSKQAEFIHQASDNNNLLTLQPPSLAYCYIFHILFYTKNYMYNSEFEVEHPWIFKLESLKNNNIIQDTPSSSELSDALSSESDQLELIVDQPIIKEAKEGNLVVKGAWVPIATTDNKKKKKSSKKTNKKQKKLVENEEGMEGTSRMNNSDNENYSPPSPVLQDKGGEKGDEPPSSRPRSGSVPRQLQGHVDGVGIGEIHAGSTPSRAVTNRILREFLASRESRAREQSSRPDDPSSDERNSSPGSVQSAFEPRSNRSREEERNRPPLGPLRHPVQPLVQQVQRGELKDVESSSASSYLNSTAARANSWSRRGIHPVLSLARPERSSGFRPNAPGSKSRNHMPAPSSSQAPIHNNPPPARPAPGTSATEREPPPPQQPPPIPPRPASMMSGRTREPLAPPPPPSYPPPVVNNNRYEAAPANMLRPVPRYPVNAPDVQMRSPPQQQAAQAMPPPSLPQAACDAKTRLGQRVSIRTATIVETLNS
ncbi:hypothetical protein PSHT_16532 [Puccinia striiformis]|uniref:Uncharacterized protein n=1 Tax=Puccinia striiformis TaxID=27350 RepID=A0A2S4U9Q7_9BASI|nr:hypothetical protein PSHT_16532 [Puccinia striiformis]